MYRFNPIAQFVAGVIFLLLVTLYFIFTEYLGSKGASAVMVLLVNLAMVIYLYPKVKRFKKDWSTREEKKIAHWAKDVLDIEWHENGVKKAEGKYLNGSYDGLWTWWDEQGNKISEENYREGTAEGLHIWWYSSGGKKAEINYVNGSIEGLLTEWYENRQKKSETNFLNGKEVSRKEWDENGSEVKN